MFEVLFEMIVTFDVDGFRARFPHLTDISDATLSAVFDDVCTMYGNTDDKSLFAYDPDQGIYSRRTFLYAATCHLATLEQWQKNGQTGRITNASQGSVSTAFDLYKSNKDLPDWWNQTLCGQQAWRMLSALTKGGRFYGFTRNHPFG